jgi:hypothetical protein
VAPVAAYATGIVGTRVRPPVGTSIEPVPSPSTSESPSPAVSQPAAAPDGRVTPDQLAHATVDLGRAPNSSLCPDGRYTFNGNPTLHENPGTATSLKAERVTITKVIDVDFDHDGALESVALITCSIQGSDYVVFALDRTADGSIVGAGRVVSTSEQDRIRTVFDLRVDSGGAIGVQVGDRGTCCGNTEDKVEHQWRSYGFDGTRFNQVGGPTKFTPVPESNDLAVTGGANLVLGAPSGGVRRGSLTVTVRNNGPKAAPGAIIEAYVLAESGLPAPIEIVTDLNDCTRTSHQNEKGITTSWRVRCHLYSYNVGASRSYTFRFASPVANDAAISADASEQFPKLYAGVGITEEQPGIRVLEDHKNEDNSTGGWIRLAA